MMVVGVFAIYLSCLMNNESMLFVFGTNIQNMLVASNTFFIFIGITSLFSLILSEFVGLIVYILVSSQILDEKRIEIVLLNRCLQSR